MRARASLRLTVAAAVVAVAVTLPAGSAQAVPAQGTPEEAAVLICAQLQAMLGAQFGPQFGSVAACQARAADVVRGALASCAQGNQACIQAAIQQGVIAMSASGGTGPNAAEITQQVLDRTCARLQSELGKNFAKKFGSAAGCKDQLRAEAAQLVGEAMAKCKGASNQDACITDATAPGIAALTDKYGAVNADEIADQIADEACNALERELGDRFQKKFGSKAGCKTQVREKAVPLAKNGIALCQKATNQEACIQETIDANMASLSEIFGVSVKDLTGEIADEVCTRLKKELGDRFAKKFGSLEACKKRVADNSEAFAADALARCLKAPNRNACMQESIEKGTATVSERFGPGPTFEELAEEVGEQVCARLKAQLSPAEWKRLSGGPTAVNCKTFYVQKAEQPIRAVLAKCQKAADREGCVAQAVQDLSTSLADEFAGPTPGDVASEIVDQACDRLQGELGAKEFAAKFGNVPRCRDQLRGDARSLAESAIAKCKKAGNRQACAEDAISEGTRTITKKFGKGGPSVTELADRLAKGACEGIQAKLGAAEFKERFESLAACGTVIKDKATELARAAVLECESKPGREQPSCVEKALRAGADALEGTLRAKAPYTAAELLKMANEITDRACEAVKGKFKSLAGCKKAVADDARSLARQALDKCKGKEACVRQEIEAQAEKLLARAVRSELADIPTADSLGNTTATTACAQARSAAIDKGRLADFEKSLGSSEKCAIRFKPLGTEIAEAAIAKCEDIRSEDKARACIEETLESQTKRIRKAIDELIQAELAGGGVIVRACSAGLLTKYTDCYTGKSMSTVWQTTRARSHVYPDGKSFLAKISGGQGTYIFYVWLNTSDREFAVVKYDGPKNTATLTPEAAKRGWTLEVDSKYGGFRVYVPGGK